MTMAKKREVKLDKQKVEWIQELAERSEKQMAEMKITPEDELEVFSETVALLITHWARTSQWSPLETVSYAGYVMTNFYDKGIGAEIQDLKTYTNMNRSKNTN